MQLAAVALAASTLIACTQHKDARTLLPGAIVTIETVDGAELTAQVAATPQYVSFVGADGRAIPDERIREISQTHQGRGALHGLLGGALGGLAIGAAIGYADGDDECDPDGHNWCILTFTAGEKAAILGTTFGGIGMVVGAIGGAIAGSKDVYTFGAQHEYRLSASAPAGSVAGATLQF